MQPNIVFLDEYSLGDADLGSIRALGNYTGYRTTVREEVADRCREADVVITNKVVFRRETLRQLPRLRLICVAATGMNHIDLEAAAELGIAVKNAVGYSTHAVTETTIGAAIGLLRQTVYYDRYVKTAYAGSPLQYHFGRTTHQLYGSKWGIVGLGNIGRSVARVAEALGCRIAYTSTSGVVREEPYPEKPLDELLRWADVVSVHAPLNDRTRNLIGARELALMKPSAILINVARGGIVDEAALAAALDAGRLAGAGLDVFTHDATSEISVTTVRHHLYFINNEAVDVGAYQLYGSVQNCVISGMTMTRCNGIVGRGSLLYRGKQPEWYIDIVNCRLKEGNYSHWFGIDDRGHSGHQSINLIGSGGTGMSIGTVIRRNVLSEYSYIRTSPGANPDAVTDVIIEDNSFDIAKNAILLGGNATNTSGVLIHNNRYNEVDKRLETNVNKDSYLVIDDNL